MKIEVDFTLFQMLVECIDKQAIMVNQDAATQAKWRAIINETYLTAAKALADFKATNMYVDGRTETGQGAILSIPENLI